MEQNDGKPDATTMRVVLMVLDKAKNTLVPLPLDAETGGLPSTSTAASANARPLLLSGSTSGRPIKVAATATAGTLIHTAVAGTSQFDSLYLFANNTDSTARKLTLEWGGTTSPDDLIEVTIPAEHGLYTVVYGLKLNGGVVVRAFAATANVINITGWVVRE